MTVYGRLEVLPVTNTDSTAPTLVIPTTWTPAQLTTALLAWFGAEYGTTLNSGAVSQWAGELVSGASVGPTLAQATTGDQPTLVSNAQNSLPGIQLGTAKLLTASTSGLGTALASDASPFTIGLCLKKGADTSVYSDIVSMQTGAIRGMRVHCGSIFGATENQISLSLVNSVSNTSLDLSASSTTVLAAGTPYSIIVTYDGSRSTAGVNIYIDGVPEAVISRLNGLTASFTSNFWTFPFAVGSQLSPNTDVVDVLLETFVASGVLATSAIANANSYFRQKWNF